MSFLFGAEGGIASKHISCLNTFAKQKYNKHCICFSFFPQSLGFVGALNNGVFELAYPYEIKSIHIVDAFLFGAEGGIRTH
ncbi:MAG: hypothetical protein K2H13_10060, partial [Eubacterium sp.]|nr:hypothetical protein [Eubacterium sp.]